MSAPPLRIRTSGLQEQQVDAVARIEEETTPKGGTPRTLREIVALTKMHNVRVAESDDVVLGYVAWRDESPGVGVVEQLAVLPRFQKFGVGRTLLELVRNEARAARLEHLLVRVRTNASSANLFFKKEGFVPLDEKADDRVLAWRDEQSQNGPLAKEGEAVLWGKVGADENG